MTDRDRELLRRAAEALRESGNTDAADQIERAADRPRRQPGEAVPPTDLGPVFEEADARARRNMPKPSPPGEPA